MSSPIYSFLTPVVKLALQVAYRRIDDNQLSGKIPKDSPVIIVSNHQNALIDPLLICVSSKRQVSFLTRASAFKNPVVAKILKQFNMLPIYRPRDSVDIKVANESVFEESIRRLCEGGIIGIFPEGSHGGRRKLRPLRKGFARMARMCLESDCDPFILPVGLDFSSQYDLNSRAILLPGRGFYSSEIGNLEMDEKQFYIAMVQEASIRIREVSLEIEDEASDKLLWRLDQIAWNDPDLIRIEDRQKFTDKLALKSEEQKIELKNKLKDYQKKLLAAERLDINLHSPQQSILTRTIVLLGEFFSWPLRKITENQVEKTKDPQFIATIRFTLLLIITPFYLILMLLIIAWFTSFFISVLSVSLIASTMYIRWKLIKSQVALSALSSKQKDELIQVRSEVEKLL